MNNNVKEFDRSVCFTYFGNYFRQVKNVEKLIGMEMAYKVQNAIVEYGLWGKEIDDPQVKMLVGEPTLDLIDSSQARRSRGFTEDVEKTQKVMSYYAEHPGASQDEISKATGVSKGKVNKVIKQLKENASKPINSSDDRNSDTVTDIDTDNDSMTVTDDRSAAHPDTASLSFPEEASPSPETGKKLTYEQEKLVISYWQEHKKIKEIVSLTGFGYGQVNETITKYKENHYHLPEPKIEPDSSRRILCADGSYYGDYTKDNFIEWNEDFENMTEEEKYEEAQNYCDLLTNPEESWELDEAFVTGWLQELFGVIVHPTWKKEK